MGDEAFRVLGIAGSLRELSFNRALIAAAAEHAPEGVVVTPFELDAIPLYRAEQDADVKPEAVAALKSAIEDADAVLFATPEYNYGIPGVLKNAIDWASRPGYRSPLRDKAVAIIGASPGVVGTARAQQQLKLVLLGTAAAVLPWPEYLLGNAAERFTDGKLTDERSRRLLVELLLALERWGRAVRGFGMNTERPTR